MTQIGRASVSSAVKVDNYTYFNGLAECVHVVIYVNVPVVLSFPWDTVFTIIQGAGGGSLLVQWLGLCASKEAQPGFDPQSGNEDPASHMIQPKKKGGKLMEDIVMQIN